LFAASSNESAVETPAANFIIVWYLVPASLLVRRFAIEKSGSFAVFIEDFMIQATAFGFAAEMTGCA
jgi:hypothetical protein